MDGFLFCSFDGILMGAGLWFKLNGRVNERRMRNRAIKRHLCWSTRLEWIYGAWRNFLGAQRMNVILHDDLHYGNKLQWVIRCVPTVVHNLNISMSTPCSFFWQSASDWMDVLSAQLGWDRNRVQSVFVAINWRDLCMLQLTKQWPWASKNNWIRKLKLISLILAKEPLVRLASNELSFTTLKLVWVSNMLWWHMMNYCAVATRLQIYWLCRP